MKQQLITAALSLPKPYSLVYRNKLSAQRLNEAVTKNFLLVSSCTREQRPCPNFALNPSS
jgi:hypothetical protein